MLQVVRPTFTPARFRAHSYHELGALAVIREIVIIGSPQHHLKTRWPWLGPRLKKGINEKTALEGRGWRFWHGGAVDLLSHQLYSMDTSKSNENQCTYSALVDLAADNSDIIDRSGGFIDSLPKGGFYLSAKLRLPG
jgi:hypothetical protein